MAVGLTVTPTSNFPCTLELPRRNWWLQTPSLGSLVSRKHVQAISTHGLPPQLRVSVLASSSLWKQQRDLVNEQANNSSPYKLSSMFLDILKQRSESGLSNDLVELQGKDGEEWDDKDGNCFVRRRSDGRVEARRDYDIRDHEISNQEGRSLSSDPEACEMKRAPRQFDSFNLPPAPMTKVRKVAPPGPFPEGTGPRLGCTREEILGEPLSRDEVRELVAEACVERWRQLDLGKDGLTHNMVDLLHRHWKRRRICRIKCYGVPTVDMDNLCSVIEEKSGGKIIRRSKSMLYVFRGRNYNWTHGPGFR